MKRVGESAIGAYTGCRVAYSRIVVRRREAALCPDRPLCHRYILVIIDTFSRFMLNATVLPDKKARTVLKPFVKTMGNFGVLGARAGSGRPHVWDVC